jgi:GNAT superfamily N-acetyltransferase
LPTDTGFGEGACVLRFDAVDPADQPTLRAFWETEQESVRHDRPHATPRTWDRLVAMMTHRNDWYRRTLLVARDGDDVVGTADLGGSTTDNLHLADLEIHVRPAHRRRGIGRALYDEAAGLLAADGRTSICAETYVPAGAEPAGVAAYAFATVLGFDCVHVEDHLLLDLPVPDDRIAGLRAKADAPAYDVLTWTGPCPDEHLEAFCEMHTRMSTDVPVGDIDYQPVVIDAERLRAREERVFRSYDGITAVARRRADGVFGGYTQLYLPHGETYASQDDTLVMPEHRGHRLGTLLKCATLEILQREHPDRVEIHTDTAVDNHAMQATNRDFGYRPVERLHEMQRRNG